MNAIVRKEMRLVAPGAVAAAILAALPLWCVSKGELKLFLDGKDDGQQFLCFWLFMGLIFPALASFGQEFSLGTFSSLLAQPISRTRIWKLKLSMIALTTGLVLAVFLSSLFLRLGSGFVVAPVVGSSLLYAAMAVSGGWWSTLLFRQTAAAFWFALLAPALIIIMLLVAEAFWRFEVRMDVVLYVFFIIYSVAGMTAARWLFYRTEDAPLLGQLISPPDFTLWAPALESRVLRHEKRARRALLGKEIQLQQVTIVLIFAMATLHLLDIGARSWCKGWVEANSGIGSILIVFPLLWLLIPILAGGVAVAEERKLGTFDSQLCAPISRRWQFVIKFAVAMGLGLMCGIIPIVIEYLGKKFGVIEGTGELLVQGSLRSIENIYIFGGLTVAFLSFYASTLSRTTLHTLGLAFAVMIVVGMFSHLAGEPPTIGERPVWGVPLANYVGIPLLTIALFALAWKNYGHSHFGARNWTRNILTLVAVAPATLLTDVVIFNRAWECCMPEEPYHNWQEPKPVQATAKIINNGGRTAVITTEGRLWLVQKKEQFAWGGDWIAAALWVDKTFGLKKDGTLWDLSKGAPIEFQPGTHWRDIVDAGGEFEALRADGTIWTWGWRQTHKGREDAPFEQVETDTNWVRICAHGRMQAGIKADGTIWRWGEIPLPHPTNSTVSETITIKTPLHWLNTSGHEIKLITMRYGMLFALMTDHTLWFSNEKNELKQMGNDAVWATISSLPSGTLAALKSDGSLWLITFRGWPSSLEARRMSDYYCWNGVGAGATVDSSDGGYNTFLSLANDGTLCQWRTPDYEVSWANWVNAESLQAPSRLRAVKIASLQ